MKRTFPTLDRITTDPRQLGGKPCLRGMRISVRRVLEVLAEDPSWEEVLADHPGLEPEDLEQALRFAATAVHGELRDWKLAG